MRKANRITLWGVLLALTFLLSPTLGQGTSELGRFQKVQSLLDKGELVAHWVGQGRVAGDIVELTLDNTTEEAIAITLESGTVLVLEDEELAREFQPILLEETVTLLVPAQGSTTRMLRGYCLEYELEPPAKGREFPYRFPPDTVAYQPALDVLEASLTYDAEKNVLPVQRQRTVVIQRAIWAALGQMTKEKLLEDIYLDAASEKKTLSRRQAERIANVIWEEVQRLLAMRSLKD
ncbi:MAG: hypothetical protein WC314_21630 [Vulcanimicrobiota bacterium]